MSTLLHECLTLSEAGPAVRVDRARGVIGPVKALGWKSANGREYLPEGVGVEMYEGRRVCVGHFRGTGDRDPRDTVAVLEGVSKRADGVYAERLRLLHPGGDFEQRVLSAAEHAPHLFGLSHTARGVERPGSGGKIIESVESVESVDLVTDPATVSGFFESRSTPVKKQLKELVEMYKGSRPLYAKALREMAEAGVMSPDASMDAPPDALARGGDHKAALMGALKALCDEADSLDEGEFLKKVKAILKIIKGDTGAKEPADEPAAAEESRRIRAEHGQLLAEKLVRKAADAARLTLTEAQVEQVARSGVTDEAKAAQAIKVLWGDQGGASQRPRSAGPVPAREGAVRESKDGTLSIPTDPAERARWLKGA